MSGVENNLSKMVEDGLFHRSPVSGDVLKDNKGHLRPDHSAWAEWIIQNFNVVTDDSIILMYDNATGRFVPGEKEIKVWMERNYSSFSLRDFSEIFEHTKNRTYLSLDAKKKLHQSHTKLLLLENGVFDIEKKELLMFSPDFLFTSAPLPFKFDSEKDCPTIKQFISEIVAPNDVSIIQEMVGYGFLKDMPFHKAFMFIGEGRNGKSTLINLLVDIFGSDNVSKLGLQQLTAGGFVLAHLKDKMLNVYPDLPARALVDTGYFKVLTGGDWLTVDRKFKDPTSFVNYAKMIFSCNKLPEAKDDSIAFFRRWILINFPNEFTPDKADPHLLSKLTTPDELSGFFNWALEGLLRLFENRGFSYSKTTDEVQDQYERLSNSLLAFVKDNIEPDAKAVITKDDFFNRYAAYCRGLNIPVKSKTVVGRELASHIAVSTGQHDRSRAWLGIKFIDAEEGEQVATNPQELLDMVDKIKGDEKNG